MTQAERYIQRRIASRAATRMEWKALHAYRRARRPRGIQNRQTDLAYAHGIFATANRLNGAHMAAALHEMARAFEPFLERMRKALAGMDGVAVAVARAKASRLG